MRGTFTARLARASACALVVPVLVGLSVDHRAPTNVLSADNSTPGSSVQVAHDVVYGTDQGVPLTLDVYHVPGSTSRLRPAVIEIHGGGWSGGDKGQLVPESTAIARGGYVAFDINYRLDLSTAPGYPREVEDVMSAYRWVEANARNYGADPARIGLFGASAGAYLAAMLATQQTEAHGPGPIKAVVSLSGPLDMVTLESEALAASGGVSGADRATGAAGAAGAAGAGQGGVQQFLGCSLGACPVSLLQQASPVSHVTDSAPPFFLANSANELVPVSQAREMAAHLQAAGVPVTLDVLPGSRHALEYVADVAAPAGEFLHRYLAPPPRQPAPPAASPRIWLRWLVAGVLVAAIAFAGILAWRRRHRPRGIV